MECKTEANEFKKLINNRKTLLKRLDEVIEFLHNKAINGRINRPENDKVRIQWFKTLAYTCSIYNQIKKDIELEELKEDIYELQKQVKKMNHD